FPRQRAHHFCANCCANRSHPPPLHGCPRRASLGTSAPTMAYDRRAQFTHQRSFLHRNDRLLCAGPGFPSALQRCNESSSPSSPPSENHLRWASTSSGGRGPCRAWVAHGSAGASPSRDELALPKRKGPLDVLASSGPFVFIHLSINRDPTGTSGSAGCTRTAWRPTRTASGPRRRAGASG